LVSKHKVLCRILAKVCQRQKKIRNIAWEAPIWGENSRHIWVTCYICQIFLTLYPFINLASMGIIEGPCFRLSLKTALFEVQGWLPLSLAAGIVGWSKNVFGAFRLSNGYDSLSEDRMVLILFVFGSRKSPRIFSSLCLLLFVHNPSHNSLQISL
jgi:hypothetical protein